MEEKSLASSYGYAQLGQGPHIQLSKAKNENGSDLKGYERNKLPTCSPPHQNILAVIFERRSTRLPYFSPKLAPFEGSPAFMIAIKRCGL